MITVIITNICRCVKVRLTHWQQFFHVYIYVCIWTCTCLYVYVYGVHHALKGFTGLLFRWIKIVFCQGDYEVRHWSFFWGELILDIYIYNIYIYTYWIVIWLDSSRILYSWYPTATLLGNREKKRTCLINSSWTTFLWMDWTCGSHDFLSEGLFSHN